MEPGPVGLVTEIQLAHNNHHCGLDTGFTQITGRNSFIMILNIFCNKNTIITVIYHSYTAFSSKDKRDISYEKNYLSSIVLISALIREKEITLLSVREEV